MEKYAVGAQLFVNEFECVFELSLWETIQSGFFEDAVDPEVRPLLQHINAFPHNAPFQISFFAFSLVDKGPGEIAADKFFVAPLVEALYHAGLATADLEYAHVFVNKLKNQIFDQSGLDVPIVDLLLLDLVAGVPIRLLVVIGQVFREVVLLEKRLVLGQLAQFSRFSPGLHFLLVCGSLSINL